MSKISEITIQTLRKLLRRLEKHNKSSTPEACTLHKLPSATQETFRLLELSVLDHPDSIACPYCLEIHHNKDIGHYGNLVARLNELGQLPACTQEDDYHVKATMPGLMSTTVFRMVMKKYHHAPDSRELLDKIACKGGTLFQPGNTIIYMKSEYKIVHGNLLYRAQSMSVPKWRYDSVPDDMDFFSYRSNTYDWVCPHIKILQKDRLHADRRIQGCQYCRTEYRVGAIMCKGYGVATLYQYWKDFGPGSTSAAWKDHLSIDSREKCYLRAYSILQPGSNHIVRYPRIASAFGDSNDTKQYVWASSTEILTLFNRRLLAREMRDMNHQKFTQRKLPRGKSSPPELPHLELPYEEVSRERPESLPPYDDK